MSWTYFTAYLDGTRPITKNERDELIDKWIAAWGTCAPSYVFDSSAASTLKGSGAIGINLSAYVPSLGFNITAEPYGFGIARTVGDSPPPFGNYEYARDAALSDEGIILSDLATMLSAGAGGGFDHYHYWNFLKRFIDKLACTPTISLTCRSKSATKTKCGFAEFGTPSSPPKIYLKDSFSGSASNNYYDAGCTTFGCAESFGWAGAIEYARPACTYSDGTSASGYSSDCSFGGAPSSIAFPSRFFGASVSAPASDSFVQSDISTTVRNYIGQGICAPAGGTFFGVICSGTLVETLSDEYTTALLAGDVDSALAAASFGGFGGCIDAIFTQTSDELTIAKRAVDTKVTFSAALAGPMALRYDIYNRTCSVLVSNNCVNLSAGTTDYTISLGAPPNPGDAYYVTNVSLTPGTC